MGLTGELGLKMMGFGLTITSLSSVGGFAAIRAQDVRRACGLRITVPAEVSLVASDSLDGNFCFYSGGDSCQQRAIDSGSRGGTHRFHTQTARIVIRSPLVSFFRLGFSQTSCPVREALMTYQASVLRMSIFDVEGGLLS